jgi:hypothetical protein
MDERDEMRRWVETWKEAGPELDRVRRREIQEADTLLILASLVSAFNHAIRSLPLREGSGLVEMQKYFAKLHP